ncbi:MAG: metal-sulfur cluster assembly factor [Ignisphaera sp.]|nr:metal-sulfur cluster assembly factor [Ignisphaera sp.]MCX8167889.1 metal-sulfur cluster assembly factor [Ignisphaera sp.]MDW8085470.1 metal-sulfur cluster assembly factor [Ignisphaera sp.]
MSSEEEVKRKIVETLKNVYDPEIPINIYDLGLLYSVSIKDNKIDVTLGVTSPFCPLAYIIVEQAKTALKNAFPDREVEVHLDLNTIWSPKMMTEDGRKLFRLLYGYDPTGGS